MRPSWEEIDQLKQIISLASGRPHRDIQVFYSGPFKGTLMRIIRAEGSIDANLPHFVDVVPQGPGHEAQRMLIYMGLAKASTRQAEFMDYAALAWEFGKQNAQAPGTLPDAG